MKKIYAQFFRTYRKAATAFLGILFILMCKPEFGLSQTSVTYNYTGAAQTFIVPTGVTSITVECWGGGGAGGGATVNNAVAGGGSGGAYTKGTFTVTAGSNITVTVGTG